LALRFASATSSARARSFSGSRVSSPQHRPTVPIWPQTVHRNCESSANKEMQGTVAPPSLVSLFIGSFPGQLPLISGVRFRKFNSPVQGITKCFRILDGNTTATIPVNFNFILFCDNVFFADTNCCCSTVSFRNKIGIFCHNHYP
jgi:hypothetical protein